MEEKQINFEEELNRLKQIVNDIQQKDISIDESLKLYEEGQKIISLLSEELKKAESKVEKVINIDK
ncbi:MAG: exodeoxyribonuclease VII small subunit [Bacilli bacterium]|nr:exodeoxyribonuclease VII small subunit [Bacilli bacterium]